LKPLSIALLAAVLLLAPLHAGPIPVRHLQGSFRSFVVLRSEEGKLLANGEITQSVRGGAVTLHAVFHFLDGSLDDETTVYSQRTVFALMSDRRIQKGPSFPHPTDVAVEAATGQVTLRSTDKDGNEKVSQDHIDVVPDTTTGILLLVQVMNLAPASPATTLTVLAPTTKDRRVKATIFPAADASASIGSLHRKAADYRIKIEIGGIAGVVAPIVGKAPDDIHIWLLPGELPAFIREQGQLYAGGPVWTIEAVSPSLAAAPAAK